MGLPDNGTAEPSTVPTCRQSGERELKAQLALSVTVPTDPPGHGERIQREAARTQFVGVRQGINGVTVSQMFHRQQ